MPDPNWDVFISYASEERPWVKENLYEPLLKCRTADGRRPRVFLDAGEEGISPGEDWLVSLLNALSHSRRIVPVYSRYYLSKRICQWELRKAVGRQLNEDQTLVPVLYDPALADELPDLVSDIQFVDTRFPDWFNRLCRGLGLRPQSAIVELRFLRQPVSALVSYTLPPVEVGVFTDGRPSKDEEEITLSAEGYALRGTTTLRSEGAVARFVDLSIGEECAETQFIATAEGCTPVTSEKLSIETPKVQKVLESVARIPLGGEPVFFEDGGALAMISDEEVVLYSTDGRRLANARLGGRPRIVRRSGALVAVATWPGKVFLFTSEGSSQSWDFTRPDGLPVVPGDLGFDRGGDNLFVYAGLWTGHVYRLALGKEPELQVRHDGGVQALSAAGRSLYVCSLDGGLSLYEDQTHISTRPLEPTVRGLKVDSGSVIAVGERSLFYIPSRDATPFPQALKLGPVTLAYMDPESPVAMDSSGRGVIFDRDLFILHSLHLAPGAIPMCADHQDWYIFRLPGGSYDLVAQGKTIYHHTVGPLAVAPAGDLWAIGDEIGISIVTRDSMNARLRKEIRAEVG